MREAELFVVAEQMLTEVLGRIREQDLDIELPPIVGVSGDGATTLQRVVERHLRDDASVPAVIAGREPAAEPHVGLGHSQQETVVLLADLAVDAARQCRDEDRTVHAPFGDVPVRDYLLRLTVVRSLVAHYVAAYLGSTACPLPEELARPLWELTAPDAEAWRSTGLFRAPLPIPDRASWRDIFLRAAGHEPHPLGH